MCYLERTTPMDIKYDTIGTGYNSTRKVDPYILEKLHYHLQPKTDKQYLDIGCGTGNYTIAFANKGFEFIGVEPSEKMLNEAKLRNQNIHWLKGTAEKIPIDEKIFDGIISTLTIHHWTDLKKAFIEINRVLSNNGRFVLFTSTPEQMKGYWLNYYFPKMLHSSIAQMPSLLDIQEALKQTDLEIIDIEKYFIKDNLQDCFLYIGKNNPSLYFNEAIRNGISSFSTLANIHEVEQGLSKLRNDIDNNTFEKIKVQYLNELGDYLFITIGKSGSI